MRPTSWWSNLGSIACRWLPATEGTRLVSLILLQKKMETTIPNLSDGASTNNVKKAKRVVGAPFVLVLGLFIMRPHAATENRVERPFRGKILFLDSKVGNSAVKRPS